MLKSPATPLVLSKAPVEAAAQTPLPDSSPALAPADPNAKASLLRRAFWYSLAFIVTSGVIAAGLRLDQADMRAPFCYDEDSLLIMPMVKATLERGSHWRNERMGAPGVLELHDFPVVDHLHFAIIWLLGQGINLLNALGLLGKYSGDAVANTILIFNLYYLLTYPLAHLTGMAVMRHFRMSFPAAFAGGLIFAFMPYHYMRGESHYFLSAYWVVPISLLAALEVCRGGLWFYREVEPGKYRFCLWQRSTLYALLICVATASAGAYYAYFACAIFLAAGLYAWASVKTWRSLASATLLIGITAGAGVLNHLPTFFYQAANGRNSVPHARLSEEAEIYGLKIAQLVLPMSEHNWEFFAKIKSLYNSDARPLQNENDRSSLGLIGAVGLVSLLTILVLPAKKRWPYGPIAALVGFSILVGTVGGFGSVFNHIVFSQVRCYNRISVYIAFLCYFTVLWFLDQFFLSRTGWARWLRYPAFIGLIVVGIWDQSPYQWFRPKIVENMAKDAARFHQDAAFFRQVEARLLEGQTDPAARPKVFTLPFVAYPESDWTQRLASYEHARGYMHTDRLAWSFGAMKGRETDAWQRAVAAETPPAMITSLVYRGFDGLIVDKRGYTPKRASETVQQITAVLGSGVVTITEEKDGEQIFFDLRQFRAMLVGNMGQAAYDQKAREHSEAPSFLWLHGFYCFEPPGSENRRRWCSAQGRLVIANPTNRERRFRIRMTLRADARGTFEIALRGLVNDDVLITKTEPPEARTTYDIVVPPGRHSLEFRCKPPDNFYSADSRNLRFYIANFSHEELP